MRMCPGRVTVPGWSPADPGGRGEDHQPVGPLVQHATAHAPPRRTAPGRSRGSVLGRPGLARRPGPPGLTRGPRGGPPPGQGPGRGNPPGATQGYGPPPRVKPGSRIPLPPRRCRLTRKPGKIGLEQAQDLSGHTNLSVHRSRCGPGRGRSGFRAGSVVLPGSAGCRRPGCCWGVLVWAEPLTLPFTRVMLTCASPGGLRVECRGSAWWRSRGGRRTSLGW